jgi:hypothetical protein
MKNKIIVVTGQGSDIEKVSIKKDQTIGQYFTKLENELNSTFDEGTSRRLPKVAKSKH